MAVGSAQAQARTPGYVEGNISNPVVAAPPVTRPKTRSCSVTLAKGFPSNDASGNPQLFSGSYRPPAGCPGPWSKVVLDFTASASGRQYDRSVSISVGTTTIYFGTTEEPDPAGLTWHVDKDVTQYTSLLRTRAPYSGGIGNYVSSVDTGVYVQTATLTFYTTDRANPAPVEPDRVVGLGAADVNQADNATTFTVPSLPPNVVRAQLEIYIKGNGCDEQWFASVPTNIATRYPQAGFCPNGPYREVDASIDGVRAGVTQYFPYIYSGGIVPTLWRPIPAIGTFNLTPETLDVTPLAGDLDRSGAHTITLSVPEANDTWNLAANLLLSTDRGQARVRGALTRDTIAPAAGTTVTESTPAVGKVDATTRASRSSVLAGWVDTSRGRVETTVSQVVGYRNDESVTTDGRNETLTQTDSGTNITTTRGGGNDWVSTHAWSYPLHVVEAIPSYVDDNNYDLTGTVDMGRQLLDLSSGRGISPAFSWSDDTMASTGVQARSQGVLTEADGHSTETYLGTLDGGLYGHYLAANHGFVTENRVWTVPGGANRVAHRLTRPLAHSGPVRLPDRGPWADR